MAELQIFRDAMQRFTPAGTPAPVSAALQKLFEVEKLDAACHQFRTQAQGSCFAESAMRGMQAELEVSPEDLARIPRKGAVVAVANHPFGFIEGLAVFSLLQRVRPDIKLMANSILGAVPEMRDRLILVDPFGSSQEARRRNARGLREAMEWLGQGGVLIVFPAGEVSHLNFKRPGIQDPDWFPSAIRLARKTAAATLPLYFRGANSALFQIAGLVHPYLRTALLPHEFLNKRGTRIEVRIGHPISRTQLSAFTDEEATLSIRRRVYWLARRRKTAQRHLTPRPQQAVATAVPASWLATELQQLPLDRCLVENGVWQVWLCDQALTPMVIRETGRLREETFRAAGEGTGESLDLDRFDNFYRHLILWHREKQEIAGAYRLCETTRAQGDLYTQTLFQFQPEFFRRMGPAIELGRSFVRTAYQRSFQALFLLWRGIGEFVARHPEHHTLFGPVSISNEFQSASRALIARALNQHHWHSELAPFVRPRKRYFGALRPGLPRPTGMEELDDFVADLEPDGKGIPVLVRHYLRLGGRIAGFHVDRDFGSTLDGLVILDLHRSDPRLLEKYIGTSAFHRIRATRA